MVKTFTLLLTLLLPLASFAEAPKAVINGPTDGQPGDLIELDFSESVADKKKVYVEPARFADGRPTFKQAKDGNSVWLASRPGIYRVTLLVSNMEGPDLLVYTVTISGGTLPKPIDPIVPKPVDPITPVPPVTPTPGYPLLMGQVREAVFNMVQGDLEKKATAAALAKLYRQGKVAFAQLSPVEFAKSQDTLNGIILAQKDKTVAWANFRKYLGETLAGLGMTTTEQHVAAWEQIALGLEAASR